VAVTPLQETGGRKQQANTAGISSSQKQQQQQRQQKGVPIAVLPRIEQLPAPLVGVARLLLRLPASTHGCGLNAATFRV